jgi:hypothetical protein
MRDFSLKLVPLLEDKIRVMIYAGAHSCTRSHMTACTLQRRHLPAALCACRLYAILSDCVVFLVAV